MGTFLAVVNAWRLVSLPNQSTSYYIGYQTTVNPGGTQLSSVINLFQNSTDGLITLISWTIGVKGMGSPLEYGWWGMSPDRTFRSTFHFVMVGCRVSLGCSLVSLSHPSFGVWKGCWVWKLWGVDGVMRAFVSLICFNIFGNSAALIPPD